jgi:pyruvate/2-oxoacid:ferredoxin oxidoreductase beta subunit
MSVLVCVRVAEALDNPHEAALAACLEQAARHHDADPGVNRNLDLTEKVWRAGQFRGPKLFTTLAVCPTGWGYDPAESHPVARLAVETGVWPLKEAIEGKVRHTYVPDRRRPVEEYLRCQRRFEHLFAPQRQEEVLRRLQEEVDSYWAMVAEERAPAARKEPGPEGRFAACP